MNEAAHITLWCKRETSVFEFTAKVSIPRKVEDGLWECDWSLGQLLIHEGKPLKNLTSMLTPSSSIRFIGKFLEGRAASGDEFYFDERLTERLDNFPALFGIVSNSEDEDSTTQKQTKG
jgi:hypothetical protein